MNNKILALVTAAVLLVGTSQTQVFAADPAPSKPDKSEHMNKDGRGDTTTPSPVDPSKPDQPAPAPDARNPVKSNETTPTKVEPTKPGSADQTK